MKSETETPRWERGFTLLEVLAAVAILGIWFVVLASVAIDGLRAEGTTERRIRASLLADAVMGELEAGLAEGTFPTETGEDREQDDFTIHVEAVPLSESAIEHDGADLMEILSNELATLSEDLYSIEVTVTWIEGTDEKRVTRTTYAWDNAELNEVLRQASGAGGNEAPDLDDLPDLPAQRPRPRTRP